MVQGTGSNPVKSANEQTLSLKRPEISQAVAMFEEDNLADEILKYQRESDDGVKYCRLDSSNDSPGSGEDVEKVDVR